MEQNNTQKHPYVRRRAAAIRPLPWPYALPFYAHIFCMFCVSFCLPLRVAADKIPRFVTSAQGKGAEITQPFGQKSGLLLSSHQNYAWRQAAYNHTLDLIILVSKFCCGSQFKHHFFEFKKGKNLKLLDQHCLAPALDICF